MSEVNYVQTVRQTFAERVKMYRKLTKPQLVSMYNERLRIRGEEDPMAKTYTKVWLANWLAEDEKTNYPDGCAECAPPENPEVNMASSCASYTVLDAKTLDPVEIDAQDILGPWDVERAGGFDALELIAIERHEQLFAHGYTPETDQQYKSNELLFGALAYLNTAIYGKGVGEEDWPFRRDTFKPSEDDEKNLVKAAAMIAAELDRRKYIKEKEKNDTTGEN